MHSYPQLNNSPLPNWLKSRPLAVAIALSLCALSSTSQAATFTVSNTNDTGAGSLRRALTNANVTAAADTINFSIASGSTIRLTGGELSITNPVTITGPTDGDPGSIIIDAEQNSRIINASMDSGDVLTLENMTLINGRTNEFKGGGAGINAKKTDLILNNTLVSSNSTLGSNSRGGGLYVAQGSLTLNHSHVSGNSTSGGYSDGGGIYKSYNGDLILNYSTVSRNSTSGTYSSGGGIHSKYSNTRLYNSTLANNTTDAELSRGGGLNCNCANLIIFYSTISNNSTMGSMSDGGGFALTYNSPHLLLMSQTTISENTVSGRNANGGGLFISGSNTAISQSTITNNSNEGAVGGAGGIAVILNNNNVNLTNSILSGNSGTDGNLSRGLSLGGNGKLNVTHSLFGDPVEEITGTNLNAYINPSNDPDLGVLQNNGGPTKTHLPNPNSPVLDTGRNASVSSLTINDQRGDGFSRIVDGTVDMGAVERQLVEIPSFTLDIDDNGEITALTDGLLVLRYLFGFSGSPLIADALGSRANRNSANDIETYMQAAVVNNSLDIDGNAEVEPLTDGLLVLRYLFGFREASLIQNAIGEGATRETAEEIESFLNSID